MTPNRSVRPGTEARPNHGHGHGNGNGHRVARTLVEARRSALRLALLLVAIALGSAMSAGATIPGGRHATAGFSSAKLTNIACWTPGRCMVVGTFVPSSTAGATGPSGATLYGNPSETLAEVSTASGWRIVRSANAGAGGSQLYGVACPAPSDCIAVGHEQPLSPAATGYRAPSYRPLVEVYSGTALHLEAVPSVGSSAAFLGASCPQPGRCFAVGYSVMAGRLSALIESDAGGGSGRSCPRRRRRGRAPSSWRSHARARRRASP